MSEPLSKHVSNPYTFSITEDISFNATCTSESTNITVTVGHIFTPGPSDIWRIFYGYNNGALTLNNDPALFGKCSPSTYKGVGITGIILFYIDRQFSTGIQNVSFSISFAKHVNINKITINNTIFNATTATHNDNDSGCSYHYDNLTVNNGDLINYFQDNDGKQITITLE